MKKIMTLVAIIMMAAMNVNNVNAQSQTNWEEQVVDLFIWGSGEASTKVAEDTIQIEKLDGAYKDYLPIVIECPEVAEIWDGVSGELVGFSKYIRVNNIAQLAVYEANNRMIMYGMVTVDKACTRPSQMVPFTDTIFIQEGKKEILKPWHWVPYEETFIQTGKWSENGTFIDESLGMLRFEIYGPTAGDTVVYTACVYDLRVNVEITNTFVIIGTEKSHYGVDEAEAVASEINIYPNPSNDGVITIKGEGIAEIFHILGQKVMDVEVKNETRVLLESGLYIVRINGKFSSKVIVR